MQAGTMTMTDATQPPALMTATPAPTWARILLIVVAAINAFDSLLPFWVIGNLMDVISSRSIEQWLLFALNGVLHPVLAIAALVLAAKGHVRRGAMVLASITFASWALETVPAIVGHGPQSLGNWSELLNLIVLPLIAVAAIALARRGERLGLAVVLAVTPTVVDLAMFAAFAIGMMIYGF